MIYFDHNATHPLSEAARLAWLAAAERYPANASSPHRLGARAERALDDARERLAGMMGCGAAEIVWTSGATEAANTLIAQAQGEVWVSAVEHPCVIESARARATGCAKIPALGDGRVDLEWLRRELAVKQPGLVMLMAANNETGVLQPWREAAEICRERGVTFACDAAQWLGRLPAAGLGACDYVIGSAHKFGGPAGVGFLKCARRVSPLLHGGPQEDGQRAGTENLPGVLAAVAGLEACEAEDAGERAAWRDEFERDLCAALPGVEVVGAGAARLWNTSLVILPERDCRQRWVVKLDKAGLAVSTGSACASGKEAPSHVLTALGLPPEKAARAIRFSAGRTTTREVWREVLERVKAAAVTAD